MTRKKAGAPTRRNRNAYCSFCGKSYRDVGLLVEGKDLVHICATCVELCQDIVDQEKCRRGSEEPFAYFRLKIDRIVGIAEEMKVLMDRGMPPLPGAQPPESPSAGTRPD
jgi:hypothetical protein